MTTHDPQGSPQPDPLDDAISARLAKLSHMPVDTTHLDKLLRAQIPAPSSSSAISAWRSALRPLSAIAAGLIVIAVVTMALLSSNPARASAADMVQMHRDIVAGKVEIMKVESVDKALAAFTELQVSSQMPAMGCCMKDLAGKKVFCILLDSGGDKITLAIADSRDCQAPNGDTVQRNGQSYYLKAIQEINMVSFERQNHRICLMGTLPAEKLMELTDGLKF